MSDFGAAIEFKSIVCSFGDISEQCTEMKHRGYKLVAMSQDEHAYTLVFELIKNCKDTCSGGCRK